MKVLNKRKHGIPAGSIYVGPPSDWGNPFTIGKDGTRDEVVEKYAEWIVHQPNLLSRLHEIKGKDLVCWCAPENCHANILVILCEEII